MIISITLHALVTNDTNKKSELNKLALALNYVILLAFLMMCIGEKEALLFVTLL